MLFIDYRVNTLYKYENCLPPTAGSGPYGCARTTCLRSYIYDNGEADKEIPDEWKEFIKFHTSFNFLEEFYDIFGDSIKKIYKLKKTEFF